MSVYDEDPNDKNAVFIRLSDIFPEGAVENPTAAMLNVTWTDSLTGKERYEERTFLKGEYFYLSALSQGGYVEGNPDADVKLHVKLYDIGWSDIGQSKKVPSAKLFVKQIAPKEVVGTIWQTKEHVTLNKDENRFRVCLPS